jgi:general nucleoside transport system ATP-binding protein
LAGGRHARSDEGLIVASRLELRAVTKRYPGTVANDAVSLCVAPGEIHAVLGENGAGKSTLMKIVYGAIQADSGDILWEGEKRTIANPAAARRLGIGMVYQHFSLFETVSVVENIAVAIPGRFDLPALAARISALGDRYGLPVDPYRLLHHLSVGERQRVEILRCLLQDPALLILDEPTSVLTPQAIRGLFEVLRTLAAGGCSILYISHKLDEIRELCDSATILRAGRVVGVANPKRVDSAELARLMVGAALPTVHRDVFPTEFKPRLEIVELSAQPDDPFGTALREISLNVHGGEIVGIAGISGNGQRELLSLLTERSPRRAEMVKLDGEPVGDLGVAARRARGLAFVPEERLGRGAVPNMTLADNALLTGHGQGLLRRGLIDRGKTGALARRIIELFRVQCTGSTALARNLSGGNLQKFIVGREMGLATRVLIVAQPTWGVDVAASAFLRQSLIDLSRRGAAILVISEELDELFEICDRIAVIYQGRLSQPKPRAATSIEETGLLMAGIGAAFEIAA